MKEINELDVMQSIDKLLSDVSDPQMRDRILRWAWSKFSPTPSSLPISEESKTTQKKSNKSIKKKPGHKSSKNKTMHTMIKNLNLRPNGKESFNDFVEKKQPANNLDKCIVIIYYLINILKEESVSSDHVYTCFKMKQWRVPAKLKDTLYWVASQKAWLDTTSTSDIKLTTQGENYVEHDLPHKKINLVNGGAVNKVGAISFNT